jgi:hypothetical protein
MPVDSLDQFDALVAALESFRQLHPGPDADAAANVLAHAPALRDQLAASVPRLTRAEIQAIDSEIATKLKAEMYKLERYGRTMDVADITDIYWPYLVKLLQKPA